MGLEKVSHQRLERMRPVLRIGICDDDKEHVSQVEEYLMNIGLLKNINLDIDVFYDGKDLVKFYDDGGRLDLLYLDIEMEEVGGIGAAHSLREVESDTLIIFCSRHDSYLMDLFDVEPFRFLRKPIQPSEIFSTFEKAYDRLMKRGIFFEYRFNKDIIRIPVHQIYYFESQGRKVLIHTTKGTESFNGKLSAIEKQLQEASIAFLRIHQSYLINFQQIKCINYTKVILQNGDVFSIGANRQKMIRQQYFSLLGEDRHG